MPSADNVNPAAMALVTAALELAGVPESEKTEGGRRLLQVHRAVLEDLTPRERAFLPLALATLAAELLDMLEERGGASSEELLQLVALRIASK